ncbi:MAG: 4-amino-4-deoxy-L-arabinose transferase-like glycosyltransferase [Chlamydiales bacterium]|jgi:4-amino-4-deoxy-L-arabinose transferase-like glycosyltransferase
MQAHGVNPIEATADTPWSVADRRLLALLAILVFGSLGFSVHRWYDPAPDAATYICTARALVAGEGYSFVGAPFILRPPGLPVLIAPILAAFGTDFFKLNLFVSVFGAVAILLLFAFQRPRLGGPLSALVSLSVWLNPGYQRLCNQVLSDVPGVTLLLACLLLARWAARRPGALREVTLGLAIGLSAYVRSITILVVPALILARLLARRRQRGATIPLRTFVCKRLVLFAVTAWVVGVPWGVRNQAVDTVRPADQTSVYSYSSGMWHQDRGDPDSPLLSARRILKRVPRHAAALLDALGGRLWVRQGGASQTAFGVLLALGLLVILVKRRDAAEFFTLGALVLFAVYFKFQDRLVLPVYVLALAATVELIKGFVGAVAGKRAAVSVAAVAVIALTVADLRPRHEWDGIRAYHEEFQRHCDLIAGRLQPEDRLAAVDGRDYEVMLERPVYSLVHAIERARGMGVVDEMFEKYDIDKVILSGLPTRPPYFLPYFFKRHDIAQRGEPVYVIPVRP